MSTTLPNVMSRYLLMMAAIISVPPVLPFAEKATPSTEGCSNDTCHKGLVVKESETCCQLLNDGQKEGEGKYSKNSFNAKLHPQQFEGQ